MKGTLHIEIAVNAMDLAKHIDEIVLFSGDGDFRSIGKLCSGGVSGLRACQLWRVRC